MEKVEEAGWLWNYKFEKVAMEFLSTRKRIKFDNQMEFIGQVKKWKGFYENCVLGKNSINRGHVKWYLISQREHEDLSDNQTNAL